MKKIDDLSGCVRQISGVVTGCIRTDSADQNLAGWGQFLESSSPVFQIGPYGTAAGIAISQIAFPLAQIDTRVCAQIRRFWNERPSGKLFPQNVRLAFTVLALAKVNDSSLLAVRDEIANVLRERQRPDGSWSDSPPHSTAPAGGQPDATAWAILALRRAGGSDAAVQRGSTWLASRVEGSGGAPLLSTLGVAAAIAGHADPHSLADLRNRGFEVLADATVNREELISFFDYDERQGGTLVQTRDYLCYPVFYPLAVLVSALSVNAGVFEAIRLDAFRSDAVEGLLRLAEGRPYKSPTARFSSTVDQAFFGLAFEELSSLPDRKKFFTFIYRWSRGSLIIQFVLPILFIIVLAAALASPATAARILVASFGKVANPLVHFATTNEVAIQAFVGILLTLLFGMPKKGVELVWDRLRGRRRRH